MGLGNLFKLAKLTITAYEDVERKKPIGDPFEVQYNPETLSIRHESVFQQQQGHATSSAQGRWSHNRSQDVSVKLVFDGTGVGYFGAEQLLRTVPTVADQIAQFLELCYRVKSKTHEPAYLKLSWGQGVLSPAYDCRLQSVDINYTAFERDGSPLRAELDAQFVEALDPNRRAAKDRLESADLTQSRIVLTGDTLPLLCRAVYGSAEHYLRVAEFNDLDDFRDLRPGQELIFPPFERRGSS